MSRKRYTPEQIISMLREAEVALAQGVRRQIKWANRVGLVAEALALSD